MDATWTCGVCGEVHEGIPLEWGFDAPAHWDSAVEANGYLSSDICVVQRPEGEGYDRFIRGVIEIPIVDGERQDQASFGIGAWVSLSEQNFEWYVKHPESDEQNQNGPWFGWLSNRIPVYPDTLNLKTNVRLRGERWRPSIDVQPADHPPGKGSARRDYARLRARAIRALAPRKFRRGLRSFLPSF